MLANSGNRTMGWVLMGALFTSTFILSNSLIAGTLSACREEAMIVFDASGSMLSHRAGRRKVDWAREAIANVLPEISANRATGLITYGGYGPPCADIFVRVEPSVRTSQRILDVLAQIEPSGATPLVDAVDLATEVLKRRNAEGFVLLVTDGLEICGRNVCHFAKRLRKAKNRYPVHTISFHLHGNSIDELICLAKETGGSYASTSSLEELQRELGNLLGCMTVSGGSNMQHAQKTSPKTMALQSIVRTSRIPNSLKYRTIPGSL
ncbi:MAG: vWA domain-containing protein [Hyphomicrobiaceae bacterium]